MQTDTTEVDEQNDLLLQVIYWCKSGMILRFITISYNTFSSLDILKTYDTYRYPYNFFQVLQTRSQRRIALFKFSLPILEKPWAIASTITM